MNPSAPCSTATEAIPPIDRRRPTLRWALSLVLGLLAALGLSASASAADVVHVCNATVLDGYGQPVSGARVRFSLVQPNNPASTIAGPYEGVTGVDGLAAIPIVFDKGIAADLHCKVIPDGLPHKIKTRENVVSFSPPAPIGQVVTVTAEMAPPWDTSPDAMLNLAGEKTAAPEHGYGHARLYQSGVYDKVVILPQGMDFFERTPDRTTADDLWFTYSTFLKVLHAQGYDVWLFRPYLTGENVHEQAAEFAQAIQRAATFGPGATGGKIIVAGYSLGAMVTRIATARWDADTPADAAWRAGLELDEEPPIRLAAFMDGALRGANVNRDLQDTLWQNNAARDTNLSSCAAGQLLRESTLCNGGACSNKFLNTGEGFYFGDADGTCDHHTGMPCNCSPGPAVSTINGDGFPHTFPVFAFSAGTWNPAFNMCHGGSKDLNADGYDVCASGAGHGGPYVPPVGANWWSVRCRDVFGNVLGSQQFEATAADLAPGSRFTLAFESDPRILHFLPHQWFCASLDSVQNFAFTFIPIDSALAADSEAAVPFPPDHWREADYQAVHNRPPDHLLGWLLGKLNESFGTGGGGGNGDTGLPPQAPGNLVADPVIGGWDQVDLTWEDRSNNEDHFEIWRMVTNSRAGDSGVWRKVDTVPANTTSFRDDGNNDDGYGLRVPTREEGTLFYFYKVRAVNDYGFGESNRTDVNLYEQPPEPSTALRPRGCVTDLLPELSWGGGDRSSKYYVRLLDASTATEAMPDVVTRSNRVRPGRALEPQKPYLLRVWGMNNVGWGSGSNPEYFRTFCGPVDPPQVLEPAACIETTTPTIRWTPVPGAMLYDGYHLLVHRVVDISNDVVVVDTVTDQPAYQVTQPLIPGANYRVKVQPNTGSNADPYSRIRFFTPMCGSSTDAGFVSPVGPTVANTDRPEFIFEPASRADSYRLEVYNTNGTQLVYARQYSAADVCRNGLCSVHPPVSLSVGSHAWWVKAGRGFTFDPYAIWAWVQVPALPTISIGPASASEAAGALTFPIALSAAASVPVTFTLRTEDGTAVHAADFAALDGPWTIPVGGTSLTVTVPLVNDALHEATEAFGFRLTSVGGALVGNDVAVGTILDDDPIPQLIAGDAKYPESGPKTGEPWTVPVRLLGQSDGEVTATVTFGVCTADGDDFAPNSQVVAFAPGETEKLVHVEVFDDPKPEGHEVIAVSLSDAQGAVIAENLGQVTIVNDDVLAIRKRGRKRSDFDGDGNNDIVWQDPSTRALSLWRMVGVNRIETLSFTPAAPVDANWKLAGVADFDGDGKPDLLWRNDDSGRLAFWLMNGVRPVAAQLIDGEADRSWKVVATGNFNGDTSPDLLWRDDATGNLKVWFMKGVERQGETSPTPGMAAWRLQGVGDFDGDGKDDLLWRNVDTGNLAAYFLDGVVPRGFQLLTPGTLPGWNVAALLDIDADGTTDIVWTHTNPDRVAAWLMKGTSHACSTFLAPRVPDAPGRSVAGPR